MASAILLLALAIGLYGSTIDLPFSLIDDGRLGFIAATVLDDLQQGEYHIPLARVFAPHENFAGPAMKLQVIAAYALFGADPAWWHLAKVLQFWVLLLGVHQLARETGCGRAAAIGACILLALFDPPSIVATFQSQIANYARLFTTDSFMAPLAVWSAVLLLMTLRVAEAGARRAAMISLVVVLSLACLTKLTFLPLVVALLLGAAAWVLLARKDVDRRVRGLVVMGCCVIGVLPGLLFFQPWNRQGVMGYESEEVLTSPGPILEGLLLYCEWMFEVGSFLLLLATVMILARLVRSACSLRAGEELAHRDFAVFVVSLLFGGSLVFQSMWPIVLPRYTIVFAPFACVLVARGVELAMAWTGEGVGDLPVRRRVPVMVAGTVLGTAAWWVVFRPYYAPGGAGWRMQALVVAGLTLAMGVPGFLTILRLRRRTRQRARLLSFPAWCMIAGHALYLLPFLVAHAHEVVHAYATRERQQGVILEESRRLAASLAAGQEARLFVNLPDGEEYGSIDLVNEHFQGIDKVRVGGRTTEPGVTLGPNDLLITLLSTRLRTHGDVPPILGGKPLLRGPAYLGPPAAMVLRAGQGRNVTQTLQAPLEVRLVALEADSLCWDPRLDLHVSWRSPGEPERSLGVFRSQDVPRGRVAEPLLILPEPITLPAGVPVRLTLTPVPANGTSPDAIDHAEIVCLFYSRLDGQPINPAPALHLYGSDPSAPSLKILRTKTFEARTRVLLPPSHLLLNYATRRVCCGEQQALANRELRYFDYVEVAGMRPQQ
ncbi:MAG: hypothetical protein KF858_05910 [Candidatus Sumerlaeia bacterium]|nr:hypothetical protein [Candidatus Sumerlaeia bacterium]